MRKPSRWIKLYQAIESSQIWKSPEPFDKRAAFVDLLLCAAWKECTLTGKRESVDLKPGQFQTSIRFLANRWHWSKCKVQLFLETLVRTETVTLDRTPNGTLITLINYGPYQHQQDTKKDTKKDTERDTKPDKEVELYITQKEENIERAREDALRSEEDEDLSYLADTEEVWLDGENLSI